MNRRDSSMGSRQAGQSGGYRSEDNSWDQPRQAEQWQGEASRQAGTGWGSDDAGQADLSRRDSQLEGRYVGDPRNESTAHRSANWDRGNELGGGRGRERGREHGWQSERTGNETGYGPQYGAHHYGQQRSVERGYRFSGARFTDFPTRDYDGSGGNDYSNFTSEDYGGRDFSGSERAGLTGGLHPSDTYRPSYGPGSWSSRQRDDDASWRQYGERRGFLQRAGDEVASWFGDEDAARRRELDHRGRGPSDYTRSDERIREDVNDALTHDWRVDASHVRVSVKEGEVTLEGTVDSRQAKRRSEDIADDVSGVRHVQNNLRLSSAAGLTAGTSTPGYSHTATSTTSTLGTKDS